MRGPESPDPERIQAADQIAQAFAKGDDAKYLPAFRAALQFLDDLQTRLGQGMPHGPGMARPSPFDSDPNYIQNAKRLIREQQTIPRVIGGSPTERDEFPDCVAVGDATRWWCSGTLVAPNVVITAGHCKARARRIFVGPNVDQPGEIVAVKEAIRHDDYGKNGLHNDLTILILDRDLAATTAVPRALAPAAALDSAFSVRIVGYGATDPAGAKGYGVRRKVDAAIATVDCTRTKGGACAVRLRPGPRARRGRPAPEQG